MSEWISVKEKHPEIKDDSVLVYFVHGAIDMVHIEEYFKPDLIGEYWYTYQGVTHWMPLPDAPNDAKK